MEENKKGSYFSVMVVGENHEELINRYVKNKVGEPYIVYKKEDAKKLLENEKNILDNLLKLNTISGDKLVYIESRYSMISEMTEDEYFDYLTQEYDKDSDGNAISSENPNGKFDYAKIGRRFSTPLKLFDETEVFQAKMGDVDWSTMHLYNTYTYEVVWEMFKEGREPKTEEEQTLYENMKLMGNYFDTFQSKEDYVTYNTAFFHYAYLDEKQGWIDMDDSKDAHEWVKNYYERFVVPLNNDDLITIYECMLLVDR